MGGEGEAPPAGIVSFKSEGRLDVGEVPFLLDIADHESPGGLGWGWLGWLISTFVAW
jgi:hypothetical protein